MKKVLCRAFELWLPLAVAIVVLSALAYVLVQQNYRSSANDPQIQIAEEITAAIAAGTPANQIAPAQGSTDISKSLANFVMLYDEKGEVIGSSAILDGKNPQVPKGALDAAKAKGINKITWEPKKGARLALVIAPFGGQAPGFVAVGRSLREVEARTTNALWLSVLGCAAALVLSFLELLLFVRFKKTKIETVEIKETVEVTENRE